MSDWLLDGPEHCDIGGIEVEEYKRRATLMDSANQHPDPGTLTFTLPCPSLPPARYSKIVVRDTQSPTMNLTVEGLALTVHESLCLT